MAFSLAAVAVAEVYGLGRGGLRLGGGKCEGLTLEDAIALCFQLGNVLIETREYFWQGKSGVEMKLLHTFHQM